MTFEEALAAAKETGLARCSDAEAMAAFCDGPLQTLVGAVSPKLVWEGAMKRGLTYVQLYGLAMQGWRPIDELQWLP